MLDEKKEEKRLTKTKREKGLMGLVCVDKKNDDRQIEKLDRIRPFALHLIGSLMKKRNEEKKTKKKKTTSTLSSSSRKNEREKMKRKGRFACLLKREKGRTTLEPD